MNYPLKSRRNPSPVRKRTLIASIAFVFLLFVFFFGYSFFSSTIKTSFLPLWTANATLMEGIDFLLSFVSPHASLVEENKVLKEEIKGLRLGQMSVEVLRYENARLREMLNSTTTVQGILVSVVSRPPYTPFDTLLLNAGEEANVEKGGKVAYLKTYLGKVIHIDTHTSQVLLASAPGELTEAFVSRTRESIRLEGRGDGNFVAVLPKAFDIVSGDTIEMSVPENFVIATVGHIDTDSASSFQAVYLKSPVSLNMLVRVTVYPALYHE